MSNKIKKFFMLLFKTKKVLFNSALLLLLLSPLNSYSFAENTNLEYKVKAAYLYNFTKFINWPSETLSNKDESLNICILGNDPFGHTIDLLVNKTAQGHKVAVKYIDAVDASLQCHIVYITKSKEDNINEILDALSNKTILTVSDINSFASKGGCISLDLLKGKVRFNINLQATKSANLKISAKLLELAKEVIK